MAGIPVKSIVDEVASAAGVPPPQAEQAVGIMLSVLSQELDPGTSAKLFASLDGADALTAANPVNAASSGWLATIAGDLAGKRAGIAMAGIAQLRQTGLSLAQIEQASTALLGRIKASGGTRLAAAVSAVLPAAIDSGHKLML